MRASMVVALWLQSVGSLVVGHNCTVSLICSAARGIFPEQGLNLCPLLWQKDSYPMCHQGSPLKEHQSCNK